MASVVALTALLAVSLFFDPPYVRRVRAAIADGDRSARTRMYRFSFMWAWIAAAMAVALLLAGGLSAAESGLRLPSDTGLEQWGGVFAGMLVGSALLLVMSRRKASAKPPIVGDSDVLLPRTALERRWFAAVAITAGITEELVFRAFAFTVLSALLPGGTWPVVLTAAVLFGLAHAYQGWAGMLMTAAIAVLLGRLYVDTGSLIPGMVVHALIDLRALLLRPDPDPQPSAALARRTQADRPSLES